jgi:ribosome-binding ATPase YchF (GTP1/OBG family)
MDKKYNLSEEFTKNTNLGDDDPKNNFHQIDLWAILSYMKDLNGIIRILQDQNEKLCRQVLATNRSQKNIQEQLNNIHKYIEIIEERNKQLLQEAIAQKEQLGKFIKEKMAIRKLLFPLIDVMDKTTIPQNPLPQHQSTQTEEIYDKYVSQIIYMPNSSEEI